MITELIRQTRFMLKESQLEFGKRFGVSHAAVSDYENGKSEASYKVIEFCLNANKRFVTCECCGGSGKRYIK